MLREIIQHENGVTYIRLTNKDETVVNNQNVINLSLTSLLKQVKKYMVDNHIGE